MLSHSPRIISSGLVFCMDPMNKRCYSGDTTLQELSKSKATGVLVSGVTPSGGSFFFDGSNDHIQIDNTNNPYVFSDTTFAVAAWVKTTGVTAIIVAKDYGGVNPGWAIQVNSSGTFSSAIKASGGGIVHIKGSSKIINDNLWHYVTAIITTNTSVSSSNSVTLYVDGVLDQDLGSGSGLYFATTLPLFIGRRTIGNFWNGNIGLVTIYNRALSQEEITQNYLAHRSRYVSW